MGRTTHWGRWYVRRWSNPSLYIHRQKIYHLSESVGATTSDFLSMLSARHQEIASIPSCFLPPKKCLAFAPKIHLKAAKGTTCMWTTSKHMTLHVKCLYVIEKFGHTGMAPTCIAWSLEPPSLTIIFTLAPFIYISIIHNIFSTVYVEWMNAWKICINLMQMDSINFFFLFTEFNFYYQSCSYILNG